MSLFKKMVAVIGFERESHVVAIKRLVFFLLFFCINFSKFILHNFGL